METIFNVGFVTKYFHSVLLLLSFVKDLNSSLIT